MGPDPLNNPAAPPPAAGNQDWSYYDPSVYEDASGAMGTPQAMPLHLLKQEAARRKPAVRRPAQHTAATPPKITPPAGYTLSPREKQSTGSATAPRLEKRFLTTMPMPPSGQGRTPQDVNAHIDAKIRASIDSQNRELAALGDTFGIGKEEIMGRLHRLREHPVQTLLTEFTPIGAAATGLYREGKRVAGELGEAAGAMETPGTPLSERGGAALSHVTSAIPFLGGLKDTAIDEYLKAGGEPASITDPQKYLKNLKTVASSPEVLGTTEGAAIQGGLMLDGFKSLGDAYANRVAARPEILPPEIPQERALPGRTQPATIEGGVAARRLAPTEGLPPAQQAVESEILHRVEQHPAAEAQVRSDLEQIAPEDRQAVLDAINRQGLEAYAKGDIKTATEAVQHAHILRGIMSAAPAVTPPAPVEPPPVAIAAPPAPATTPEAPQGTLFAAPEEAPAPRPARTPRPVATAEPTSPPPQMGLFGAPEEAAPIAPVSPEIPAAPETPATVGQLADQIVQTMTRDQIVNELGDQGGPSDPRLRVPTPRLATQLALKRLSTGALPAAAAPPARKPARQKKPTPEQQATPEASAPKVMTTPDGQRVVFNEAGVPQPIPEGGFPAGSGYPPELETGLVAKTAEKIGKRTRKPKVAATPAPEATPLAAAPPAAAPAEAEPEQTAPTFEPRNVEEHAAKIQMSGLTRDQILRELGIARNSGDPRLGLSTPDLISELAKQRMSAGAAPVTPPPAPEPAAAPEEPEAPAIVKSFLLERDGQQVFAQFRQMPHDKPIKVGKKVKWGSGKQWMVMGAAEAPEAEAPAALAPTPPAKPVTPAAAPMPAPAAVSAAPVKAERIAGSSPPAWRVPGTDYHVRLVNDNFETFKGGDHIGDAPTLPEAQTQIQQHMAPTEEAAPVTPAAKPAVPPLPPKPVGTQALQQSWAEAVLRSRRANTDLATAERSTRFDRPVIAVNEDGMVLLDKLARKVPQTNARAMTGDRADQIIVQLRDLVKNDPKNRQGLAALADAMEEHRTPHGNVVLHRHALSEDEIDRVAVEELFHDWQLKHLIGDMQRLRDLNQAMRDSGSADAWQKAKSNVGKLFGYSPLEQGVEAPAWVAAGDHDLLGVSKPEAVKLLADYFGRAAKIFGNQVVDELPVISKSLEGEVRDEIGRRNLQRDRADIAGGRGGRDDTLQPAESALPQKVPRRTRARKPAAEEGRPELQSRLPASLAELKAEAEARDPSREPAPVWYLKSNRVIADKMKGPMAGPDALRMLQNNGITADELKWTGLDDYLPTAGRVTPEQLKNFISQNAIQVKEVTHGAGEVFRTPFKTEAELRAAISSDDQLVKSDGATLKRGLEVRKTAAGWNLYDTEEGGRSSAKYASHQEPGGENYRELLLTLPEKQTLRVQPSQDYPGEFDVVGPDGRTRFTGSTRADAEGYINEERQIGRASFRSPHWDEPNVLAHVRMNDRVTPDGKKLLHIEELQSDWHQKGRREGYKSDLSKQPLTAKFMPEGYWEIRTQDGHFISNVVDSDAPTEQDAIREARRRIAEEPQRTGNTGKIPDAPFKKTWQEMALRRMIRYAAENGYDGISWTGGAKQAERYDLSKQISRIEYDPDIERLKAYDHKNRIVMNNTVGVEELPDYIGKEATEKLTPKVEEWKNYNPHIEPQWNREENAYLLIDENGKPIHDRWGVIRFDTKEQALHHSVGFENQAKYQSRPQLSGLDLKVGGEGMHGFYDKIIPDYLNKFGKKFGARVERTSITGPTQRNLFAPHDDGVQYLPITDSMRDSALEEGMSLFSRQPLEREKPQSKAEAEAQSRQPDWVRSSAQQFVSRRGSAYHEPPAGTRDTRAMEIADAYDAMKHEPDDPAVKASYAALKKGIDAQWNHAIKSGVTFEPWDRPGQPYANSAEMKADIENNGHLYFFLGGDMPADHPLAEVDPKTGYTYNDKLRAVHDFYGHAAHGWDFGERGEENAWITHSQMFPREALPALTTETKGQNNWVNFGPHMRRPDGTLVKKGDPGWLTRPERPFAEQKAGLLPVRFNYRLDAPVSFISPNTLDIPGVTEAQRQLKSDIHNKFVDQAHALAKDMGLNVVTESALGSWQGGAENSLAVHYPFGTDPELVKYYEANLGKLGYQYATARFIPDANGPDKIHHLWVDGKTADAKGIAKILLSNGIANSTIIPAKDGYGVTLIESGDELTDNIRKVIKELGVKSYGLNRGTAEFPGDYTDRDSAERGFLGTLEEIESRRQSLRGARRAFESRPDYDLLYRAIRENQTLEPPLGELQSRQRKPQPLGELQKAAERRRPPGSTVPISRAVLLPKYRTQEGIGEHLEAHTRQTLDQLYPGDTPAEHRAMVNRAVSIARDELKYQLAQENSGSDWYINDIRGPSDSLMSEMKKLHPELRHPTQEKMFLLFAAATSPGKTAAFDNVNIAEQVYDLYKYKKQVPLRQPDGKPWGTYGNAPLRSIEGLLKYFKGDEAKATKWMLSKHSLDELKEVKAKSGYSEESVENALPPDYDPKKLYGAYILGKKVGPFFMNLNGISSELTVDIWFMRTWNRMMGTLVGPDPKGKKELAILDVPRGKRERTAMIEAIGKLEKEFGLTTSQVQAALWYYEQGLYNRLGKKGTYGGTYANAGKEVADLRSQGFTSRGERDDQRRYDAERAAASRGAGAYPEGVRPEDTGGAGAGSGELFGDTSFAPEHFEPRERVSLPEPVEEPERGPMSLEQAKAAVARRYGKR